MAAAAASDTVMLPISQPDRIVLEQPQPPQAISGPDLCALLEQWAAEPAMPTMTQVPRQLRARFGSLGATLIQRAVDLSLAKPTTEADTKAARNAHLLAWSLPGLILRRPPGEAEDAPDEARAANLQRAAVAKERMQKAERGGWQALVAEAVAERSRLAEEQEASPLWSGGEQEAEAHAGCPQNTEWLFPHSNASAHRCRQSAENSRNSGEGVGAALWC